MTAREAILRLRQFLLRPRTARAHAELDEELQFHLEHSTQANIAAGMTAAEARRRALLEFGGVEQAREETWRQRPGWLVETILQDGRYALRQLRRNRGFTLTSVITLGLGIGATASIFSAVYSLLLKPLQYPDSNRLMWVSNVWPKAHI